MIWGIGAGRCGTATYAFENGGLHEPYPLIVEEAARYWRGERSPELLQRLEHRLRARLWAPVDLVVDLKQSLVIPAICELDPQAEFIWLLRDPESSVRSMLSIRYYNPDPSWPLAVQRAEQWRIRPSTRFWDDWSLTEKCCWYWLEMNKACDVGLADTGAPFRVVDVESLGPKKWNPGIKSNRYTPIEGPIEIWPRCWEAYKKWRRLGSSIREVEA